MPEFAFEDARFDDASTGWVHFHASAGLSQRHLPDAARMFCETVATGSGSRDEAVRLLRGSWGWWEHGRSSGFQENADGSTSQVLAPIWWNFPRMALQIFPAVTCPGNLGAVRLPILVDRSFRGLASLDVWPESAGRVVIRSRYHGAESHIPFMSLATAMQTHLRAEAGSLTFPFPAGTGFPGLLRRLGDCAIRR